MRIYKIIKNMPFQKGHPNFNKGTKFGPMSQEHKNKIGLANKGRKPSLLAVQKSILARKGRLYSDEERAAISKRVSGKNHPMFGKKHSSEARAKMSAKLSGVKRPYQQGEKSRFWKGGKTDAMKILRQSLEYRLWRTAVFTRDAFTCIWCGQVGGKLDPDHIKPFAFFPELRFAIDNGRTLCHECHKKTDTYGRNRPLND